ncbi:glycosyltransferase [candidate division KSB1 bacterium]|nr:glycosyltransferase [candidate division KSB1 bacterium]
MSRPFYSIIIPSYNRQDEIEALLQSFQRLDFPVDRYELIIADDGSTDGTRQSVALIEDTGVLPLIYLSQKNRGPGAARNLGMEHARGDVFIFIDSDCTVIPTWLREIDKALQADPSIDAFGGPDGCRDNFPPLLKAINYSMTSFITTGGIRGHKKKKLGKFYPRSFNMGLRRDVYEQIGGFGELRHGQDIEYSNRIIRSGAKVARIENALVYHKRRTSVKKFFRQVFNWGVARINLYKIDSVMLEPVHFFPAIALWLTLLVIGMTLFIPGFRPVGYLCVGFGLATLIGMAIHAAIINKNIRTGLYMLIISPIQIYGYGIGFSIALMRRVVLKQGTFTGFTKKYY